MLWAQEVTDNFFERWAPPPLSGAPSMPPTTVRTLRELSSSVFRVWADRFGKDTRIVGTRDSLDREQ